MLIIQNLNIIIKPKYLNQYIRKSITLAHSYSPEEELLTTNKLKMQISIEQMVGQNFQVEVEQEDSVESLKMKIYMIISIDPDQQRLIYQGQLMVQDKTISYYNIVPNKPELTF